MNPFEKDVLTTGALEHHRACFADACRILANHHISRFEDGADALAAARACAMGLIAAAPDRKRGKKAGKKKTAKRKVAKKKTSKQGGGA